MDLNLKKIAIFVVAGLIALGLATGLWDVTPLQEWITGEQPPVVEQPVE